MHTMHLLPSVEIQPNLKLKTRPKQLLGYLPLVMYNADNSNRRAELSLASLGDATQVVDAMNFCLSIFLANTPWQSLNRDVLMEK
jgi:hypothetical protein